MNKTHVLYLVTKHYSHWWFWTTLESWTHAVLFMLFNDVAELNSWIITKLPSWQDIMLQTLLCRKTQKHLKTSVFPRLPHLWSPHQAESGACCQQTFTVTLKAWRRGLMFCWSSGGRACCKSRSGIFKRCRDGRAAAMSGWRWGPPTPTPTPPHPSLPS